VAGAWSIAPLAAPLLALAGALAVACFVKAFGAVFLGPSRSAGAERAHESPPSMLVAMSALAFGCIAIGALPAFVMPVLDRVVNTWIPLRAAPVSLAELVPWHAVMAVNAALVALALIAALVLRMRAARRPAAQSITWDCGYSQPAPTMAYTASSFAQILVDLYRWLLRPRAESAVSKQLFAPPQSFHSAVPEPVMEGVLAPLWLDVRRALLPLRALQQGRVHRYLVYMLLTLCALLASLVPLEDMLVRFFGW
ncbi:MAG TPA: hydrogenase, partial [Myxococcota bacterium]|nr:hydrogenase [Myxococcota bacterium]